MHTVEAFASVEEFLDATVEFRATEPVLANLIGSIAESVRAGREYEAYQWLAVRDDGGVIVGAAARTAPHNLVVSPMSRQAAAALGRYVAVADPSLPGISGPRDVVGAIADELSGFMEQRLTMVDVALVLDTLIPPPRPIAGSARRATVADADLLLDWLSQFAIDAGLPRRDSAAGVADGLARGALWLWAVDGEPVALAGHASLVPVPGGRVGRIGPVYTPADRRGRGYGTAVTHALIMALQPHCTTIMLFADAMNPTSLGVYGRLGFRPAAEVVEVELHRRPIDFDNHFH